MKYEITLADHSKVKTGPSWETIDQNGNIQSYATDEDGNDYKVVTHDISGPIWAKVN